MRPTIERIVTLNDLVDSVPEEIFRQIQEESNSQSLATTQEESNMSAKSDVSKSQRIRDYIATHPKAKGKEIVDALSQYGVKIYDVGNVKAKLKKDGVSPKASSSPSPKAAPTAGTKFGITITALEAGTRFLKEAGSLNNAKELLTIIDQIRGS